MKIRKFNPAGIEAYKLLITASKANFAAGIMMSPVPDTLLLSDLYTSVTEYDLPEIPKSFDSKWELGKFIDSCIPADRSEQARTDGSMFSWLSALLFDQTTDGRKEELREERAYIANTGYQHFYRHLILGPYFFYVIARDNPVSCCTANPTKSASCWLNLVRTDSSTQTGASRRSYTRSITTLLLRG